MAENIITISELEAITEAPGTSYIPIDDGTTTNKITVNNFNASSASSAASSATAAAASATAAESFAKGNTGSRTGENTDNAKYYMEQTQAQITVASQYAATATTKASAASDSADAAATSATTAGQRATAATESAASAATSATTAGSAATTANYAKAAAESAAADALTYKDAALAAKTAAEEVAVKTPYVGANGNWYVWDRDEDDYVDSEVAAQGPQGPTGETGEDGVSPTVEVTSITDGHRVTITDADHPSGQSFDLTNGVSPEAEISTIAGGHRVTIYDDTHPQGQSFDVLDGSGSGDMSASTYDPTSAVALAGGIPSYVAGVLPTVPTKTSDLTNDSNFVADASYVHTDNNYTSTEKNKLDAIEAGAEVNVQSDWNVTDNTSKAYIKNKPTVPDPTNFLDKSTYDGTGAVGNAGGIASYVSSAISGKANSADLAAVATSGSYNDLSNKPTIPSTANCYETTDTTETALEDGDFVPFYDASATASRKSRWSNIKSVLKTYFDGLYKGISSHDAWSEVTNKPFSSVGSGLSVSSDTLAADVQSANLSRIGTASATVTSYQKLQVNGSAVGAVITGTMYLQSSSKTTADGVDTFTFTNSNITSSADYDVSANVFGVAPVDMVLSGTTMQVKFDSSDNVTSCRLYIK